MRCGQGVVIASGPVLGDSEDQVQHPPLVVLPALHVQQDVGWTLGTHISHSNYSTFNFTMPAEKIWVLTIKKDSALHVCNGEGEANIICSFNCLK